MTDWTSREAAIPAPPRRRDLLVEDLDGQAILADPRSGRLHRLNETALAVWRACDGDTTMRAIAMQLTETYDVDCDTALDYVEQLVARFAEAELLASPL